MGNLPALAVQVIDFDGTRTNLNFTSTQVISAESILEVSPSQIVLAQIFEESLDFSQVAELFTLSMGEFDEYETINQDALAEIDPDGEFSNWDDWYESNLTDLHFSRRFIRISKGGEHQWLWLLQVSSEDQLPVLINEHGFAGANKIAAHSWFSESDVPVTWSGGADLFEISENLYLENVYGDSPEDPTLTRTNGSEGELLTLLEDFCMDEMRQADVAIALESQNAFLLTDPERSLVEAHLERYFEYSSLSIYVSGELLGQLKSRLEQKSAIYRRLKGFFKNPIAPENLGILAAFQQLSETGYTGSVNGASPDWV